MHHHPGGLLAVSDYRDDERTGAAYQTESGFLQVAAQQCQGDRWAVGAWLREF